MFSTLIKNQRGQGAVEALFVIPVIIMVLMVIVNVGFLMYDWAVISYNASTTAVKAATVGQFNDTVRAQLAQNIQDLTTGGNDYTYSFNGTTKPGGMDSNTVYIWGTDKDTQVQKGNYIHVYVSYPYDFKLFIIDALGDWSTSENSHRINMNFAFPSEVYFE